jgi:hypothetical protein
MCAATVLSSERFMHRIPFYVSWAFSSQQDSLISLMSTSHLLRVNHQGLEVNIIARSESQHRHGLMCPWIMQ